MSLEQSGSCSLHFRRPFLREETLHAGSTMVITSLRPCRNTSVSYNIGRNWTLCIWTEPKHPPPHPHPRALGCLCSFTLQRSKLSDCLMNTDLASQCSQHNVMPGLQFQDQRKGGFLFVFVAPTLAASIFCRELKNVALEQTLLGSGCLGRHQRQPTPPKTIQCRGDSQQWVIIYITCRKHLTFEKNYILMTFAVSNSLNVEHLCQLSFAPPTPPSFDLLDHHPVWRLDLCSPSEKAFKVKVVCSAGMLMSPVTFPEVSGRFFSLFLDTLHGFGGRIKMLSRSDVL